MYGVNWPMPHNQHHEKNADEIGPGRPMLCEGDPTVIVAFKCPTTVKQRIHVARLKLGLNSNSDLIRSILEGWLADWNKAN